MIRRKRIIEYRKQDVEVTRPLASKPRSVKLYEEQEESLKLILNKYPDATFQSIIRACIDSLIEEESMGLAELAMLRNEYRNKRTTKETSNKSPNAETRFERNLKEGSLDQFNLADWHRYANKLCRELNIKPVSQDIKTNAILKSILANYTPEDLKLMLDFIVYSGQTAFDPASGNLLYCLSKKWLDFTFNQAMRWDGEKDSYTEPEKKKRKLKLKRREYTEDATKDKGGVFL